MIRDEGENKNKRGLVKNGSDEIFSVGDAVLVIGSASERIQQHPQERCSAPSCTHLPAVLGQQLTPIAKG